MKPLSLVATSAAIVVKAAARPRRKQAEMGAGLRVVTLGKECKSEYNMTKLA